MLRRWPLHTQIPQQQQQQQQQPLPKITYRYLNAHIKYPNKMKRRYPSPSHFVQYPFQLRRRTNQPSPPPLQLPTNPLNSTSSNNPLIHQMLAQSLDHLHLILRRQPRDRLLNHTPHRSLVDRNKTMIIHVCEKPHDELAVHPIRNPAVSWNRIAEVFDVECPFQAGREEAAKGGD